MRLMASRPSEKHTCYCVAGSSQGDMFQCNFSAERVRREAMEWSDKGSWPLVWAVRGGLKRLRNSELMRVLNDSVVSHPHRFFFGWEVKHLQETETSPVAYDTPPRLTMTWMAESLHQHPATMVLICQVILSHTKMERALFAKALILRHFPHLFDVAQYKLQV